MPSITARRSLASAPLRGAMTGFSSTVTASCFGAPASTTTTACWVLAPLPMRSGARSCSCASRATTPCALPTTLARRRCSTPATTWACWSWTSTWTIGTSTRRSTTTLSTSMRGGAAILPTWSRRTATTPACCSTRLATRLPRPPRSEVSFSPARWSSTCTCLIPRVPSPVASTSSLTC